MAAPQLFEQVAVDQLQPHPENPRRGDVDAIVESITANGFYGSIVAQRSTGYVLVGNHRLEAARRLGFESVPVVWADVDDDRARRILVVDNRSNDIAGWDDAALAALLSDLTTDLSGTGYSSDDLDDLIASLERHPSNGGADERYTPTTAEHLERYTEAGVRYLVLEYSTDLFGQVVDALGTYRAAHELDDNATVVAHLLGVQCAPSSADVI